MKRKICFIVAEIGTAQAFLKDHIAALSHKYDVYLVANIKDEINVKNLDVMDFKNINICRKINIKADLKALYELYLYMRKMRFDAVHSVTPKAGLLTALASFVAGIPHRIHIYTGQVWATKKGVMRFLLMLMDKLIAVLDNHILVDGNSQRDFLLCNHIVSKERSQVLGAGSICGVNVKRFNPQIQIRKQERSSLKLAENYVVFVFLGRLNKDKGIFELLEAFNQLASQFDKVFLLLAGRDEEDCLNTISSYNAIKDGVNFKYIGITSTPEFILQAGDVFCLPSYREGFGSSVIEASCLGLPVICSDAYGVLDAMVENETGLRCKVGDIASLYRAMKLLYESVELRNRFGKAGRRRVLEQFDGAIVTREWIKYYQSLLD